MADKGKPYFIELYSADKDLINKYKFVINASTVAELKDKIRDKLVNKQQIEQN